MGALLVRIAANSNRLEPFRPLFSDFISLCGPHTGLYYMDSAVVGAGLWLYEKWKKAISLKQLALRGIAMLQNIFFLFYCNNSRRLPGQRNRYFPPGY